MPLVKCTQSIGRFILADAATVLPRPRKQFLTNHASAKENGKKFTVYKLRISQY